MPCPFGFTAGDPDEVFADEDGEVEDLSPLASDAEKESARVKAKKSQKHGKRAEDEDQPADAASAGREKQRKPKKAGTEPAEGFDYEKDPVRWFYQNQIKSEADFQKKKASLRELARKRLDDIMAKKGKNVAWPESDSELDSLSIRSSELSDLDSDVNSLASLMSCAESWIEDSKYPTPAENTLKWTLASAGCVVAYLMWVSFLATSSTRKVLGVVVNGWWPTATFFTAGVAGAVLLLAYMATRYRSKRMLLGAQCGLVSMYAVTLALTSFTLFQPTVVDTKLRNAACVKYNKSDTGSKLCKMLPTIEAELRMHMENILWADALLAVLSIGCTCVGVWYMFELAYIEKRAIKHKRRHKRRKHSIPWDKIKIVGPVMNCGAGPKPAGAAAGKCPIGFGAVHAAPDGAGKCPIGFGAATTSETKKSK